jgi:type II secretion system protein H
MVRQGAHRISLQALARLQPGALPPDRPENRKSQIVNRKSSSLSAFTLIELMVVMALIGIMTAMILPEMKGTYEDAVLRSTSRELVSACSLASSHAVSLNQAHRLRLDRNGGHYSIERRGLERGSGGRFIPARDVIGGEGDLDRRITIELHKTADEAAATSEEEPSPALRRSAPLDRQEDGIVFYPDGTADATEIVLRDRDGFRLALRINPVTARVQIIELARE